MYQTAVVKIFDPEGSPDLIVSALRLRKRTFVDNMKWQLDTFDDIEVDQYDTPNARYVVVFDDNRQVVGSTRLLPTTNEIASGYSYMIRDAVHGKLPNIPDELMEEPPVDPHIWEATRFAVPLELPPSERNIILTLVCEAAVNFAKNEGATEILGLMSPFFLRWLPRAGFEVSAGGPRLRSGSEPICVIRYSIN